MSETASDSESVILEKLESIENRLDRLEESGGKPSGNQPDSKLKVWNDSEDVPGCPKIAEVVRETLQNGRINTGTVQTITERSQTRCLQIMRELGKKHPRITCRKKTLGRNQGLFLYKKSDLDE